MPHDKFEVSNLRLAMGFALLLVVLVAGRLLIVWTTVSPGWERLVVSFVVLAVFVGIPAAYGLGGLLRGDDDDG